MRGAVFVSNERTSDHDEAYLNSAKRRLKIKLLLYLPPFGRNFGGKFRPPKLGTSLWLMLVGNWYWRWLGVESKMVSITSFNKVITVMVIKPLDDRTHCARSAFTGLCFW